MFSIVSSENLIIGEYTKGSSIDVIQTCASCSYNNITWIQLVNGSLVNVNQQMQKDGSFFNLTLSPFYSHDFGLLKINGVGDPDGTSEEWQYYVRVGEELTSARSNMFNFSIALLMILFVASLIGIFYVDNYIGKFTLYWVCHVLFIVGTFGIWQFNDFYSVSFWGIAGVWKILFYVSIIAMFPMLLLSLAWVFYIHTFNEHFEKLIEKGGNTEEAFRMAKKKSGGWFNGR